MEQRAKMEWDLSHFGDPNPYESLPAINIYTCDLGNLMSEFVEDEKAFNFREFFRPKDDGNFAHEKDVVKFLDLLCKDDKDSLYPYSREEFRRIFRHTLWVVPGVKAAKALSAQLKSHSVFSMFQIVNVAGNGDEDEENADDENGYVVFMQIEQDEQGEDYYVSVDDDALVDALFEKLTKMLDEEE